MLETNQSNSLSFEVSDDFISVFPGIVRTGNKAVPFRGATIPFSSMVSFSSYGYQNSILFIQDFQGFSDLTSVVSSVSDSTMSLVSPELPSDSSGVYSPVHPIGLFTFWAPDGTTLDLVSYSRIS